MHYQKSRTQVDDYAADFSEDLAGGETIASADWGVWRVNPGGTRVDVKSEFDSTINPSISGAVVTIRMKAAGASEQRAEWSPGVPVDYELSFSATTNLGRTIPGVATLRVYRKATSEAT